jgi:hypothetical protein
VVCGGVVARSKPGNARAKRAFVQGQHAGALGFLRTAGAAKGGKFTAAANQQTTLRKVMIHAGSN